MTIGEELARLQAAVRNDPLNGELRYLLGAELAQEQNYEQAVIELATAVRLQPSLHTASFQLGLLHLTLARPADSLAAWAPLDALADNAHLKLFKQGLEALIQDDFALCTECLERGIAVNTSNAPLNRDMALLVSKARAALAEQATSAPAPPLDEAPLVRTDFSLYGQTRQ